MSTANRKYIRCCFRDYVNNKRKLENLVIPSLKGMDYSKAMTTPNLYENGQENAVIKYIDEKAMLEKRVDIVRKTIEHFKIEDKRFGGRGKLNYIYARFLRRLPYRRAAYESHISERTAMYWEEDIYYTAECIAEEFKLW